MVISRTALAGVCALGVLAPVRWSAASTCSDIYKLTQSGVSEDFIERAVRADADNMTPEVAICLEQLEAPRSVVELVRSIGPASASRNSSPDGSVGPSGGVAQREDAPARFTCPHVRPLEPDLDIDPVRLDRGIEFLEQLLSRSRLDASREEAVWLELGVRYHALAGALSTEGGGRVSSACERAEFYLRKACQVDAQCGVVFDDAGLPAASGRNRPRATADAAGTARVGSTLGTSERGLVDDGGGSDWLSDAPEP